VTNSNVIVVGSGVAGLSAAVRLSLAGRHVTLVERNQYLGGRTRSFKDETTGDVVDNGQHLLMGCYHDTIEYLQLIGSRHLAILQPSLHIDFADVATGQRSSLHASGLPAPAHVFTGLLQLSSIPIADRIRLVNVGIELLRLSARKEQLLRSLTVEEWLKKLGQSEKVRTYLWDVIAIGSLNDSPSNVSALPFVRVLRSAFFGHRTNASMLIPKVGLSELLVDPAARLISEKVGQVRLGAAAKSVRIDNGRATGILLESGESLDADDVILAVPHFAASSLLADSEVSQKASALHSSPIITVNLWFDRPVMEPEFVALLNGRMQWAFNRSKMLHTGGSGQYIACVISGAGSYVDFEKDQLVKVAVDDLSAVFPAARAAVVRHSLVLKEMRATFSPTPAAEKIRTSIASRIPHLLIAGDWTNTGLPATIEGAVMSGRKAAEGVIAG